MQIHDHFAEQLERLSTTAPDAMAVQLLRLAIAIRRDATNAYAAGYVDGHAAGREQLAREIQASFRSGHRQGYEQGYAAAVRDLSAAQVLAELTTAA